MLSQVNVCCHNILQNGPVFPIVDMQNLVNSLLSEILEHREMLLEQIAST